MRIRILSAASLDLLKGKRFYELQSEGLGDYFIDSLSSDIDSLILYGGVHRVYRVLDCLQNPSKTPRSHPEPGPENLS